MAQTAKTQQTGRSAARAGQPSPKISLDVTTEFDHLASVLLHRPGSEIDRLSPDNCGDLLFEDIPYLRTMQAEHDGFVDLLRAQGIEVLLLEQLVGEVLTQPRVRQKLIVEACALVNQPGLAQALLDLDAPQLITALFSGITARELDELTGGRFAPSDPKKDFFLLPPVPNSYFTRDPAVVLHDSVVVCQPHFAARRREPLLIRTVLERHPRFALPESKFLYGMRPEDGPPYTIEGGDILVLSAQAIAVGASQRTRSESIQRLATRLFRDGLAVRVYEVPIPAERTYMHLDTVFTIVSSDTVVAYPDVMNSIRGVVRYEPVTIGRSIEAQRFEDNRAFFSILSAEFGVQEISVCETGGREPHKYAAREQRADGTNMFAIAPSVVVSYDRSEHTNRALERLGVKVLPIVGSELVRGLGGPRCMTMPLRRVRKGE